MRKNNFFTDLVLRTSSRRRLNKTSLRRRKWDVFKKTQIWRLLPDLLKTPGLVVRRHNFFQTSWRWLKDVCVGRELVRISFRLFSDHPLWTCFWESWNIICLILYVYFTLPLCFTTYGTQCAILTITSWRKFSLLTLTAKNT